MSLKIAAILGAVRTRWLAIPALVTLYPDIYMAGDVPRSAGNRFATFAPISLAGEPELASSPKRTERLSFDLVLRDDSSSVSDIATAIQALTGGFDDATLAFTGDEYGTVLVTREAMDGPTREGRMWRVTFLYEGVFYEQ